MKINTENNEISLRELLLKMNEWKKYIISKWLILFLSIIIGSILGLVYSLKNKPVYFSTITFALEDEGLCLASQFGNEVKFELGSFSYINVLSLFKLRCNCLIYSLNSGKLFLFE